MLQAATLRQLTSPMGQVLPAQPGRRCMMRRPHWWRSAWGRCTAVGQGSTSGLAVTADGIYTSAHNDQQAESATLHHGMPAPPPNPTHSICVSNAAAWDARVVRLPLTAVAATE